MTKYLKGGLLLLGWLLSGGMSWGQDQAVFLSDLAFVFGAGEARTYLREEMQAFSDQHHVRLAFTLLPESSPSYEIDARLDESDLLQQASPCLAITTWHGQNKYYRRHQVQINEALAHRLPPATAEQIVNEWLTYYDDLPPQSGMQMGLELVLIKLGDYLKALPPPEVVPTITFANGPATGSQPPLGLDAFTYEVFRSHYDQETVNEESYPVAWKALLSGQATSVLAQVDEGVSFPPGLVFKQNDNTIATQPTSQNHQQQLNLTGQMHEEEGSVEVYASEEEEAELVGKLKTISYDALYQKLVLVVLDDVMDDAPYLARLSRDVQAILAQAGVSLTVESQEFDTGWGNRDVPLQDETSGLLSNYPDQLKRVIKDYRKEHEEEKETAYIFLAGGSSTGKLGYMPKKRAYGFVYLHEHDHGEPVAKTIAHELGHGLFRLEHTFEAYPALTKGSTNNLMDYGRGTRLHKYQWDLVHNPEAMLGWFQEEQESASYGDPYAYLWKEINALTSGISYSLYQFNEWVAASRRSILSLFDFSDVDLTSDEEKVYEILTAVKEGSLASLSGYAAKQIIVGQDLRLGEESYEKLIVHFLQAPAAIDTDYGTEDEAEKGYSLLIFGEEGKIDQEVLKVQVASEQKEALVAYLFGIQEEPVVKEEEVAGDTIYTFFVTNDDAWYREKEAPYKTITPVPATDILAQGVQVSVLEVVKDNKNRDVAKMKLKSTDSIAYTSLGNLSEVKAMSKELTYKMTKDYTAVKLPYSSASTNKTYKKDTEFTAYKRCGDYVKVKGEGGSVEGHWILESSIKIIPSDNTENFDWMTDVTLNKGAQVSGEIVEQIIKNRNNVNDRTDREVFGRSVRVSAGGGQYYIGKTNGSPNFSGTAFEKEVKKEIYNEIGKEGGVGAINTYDGEIFTWGKGFAVRGLLMDVIQELLNTSDKNYKQLFTNVGIVVVNKNFWIVDDSGSWTKDNATSKSYKASEYIAASPQLLDFFMELAEKDSYTQDVLNTQVEVFTKKGAGKYPSYILNNTKTAYVDNWSHESVTVLAHLSHWAGYRWSEGTDRYKDTKGDLDKIIYKYLYNSAKKFSSLRIKSALTTGIYRWNTSFNVMDRLRQFGNPESAGLSKLNSTWSSHTIKISFTKDKNDVLRAKKSNETKHITNNNCVLIKKDAKYLIVTKDASAITYNPFESKNNE